MNTNLRKVIKNRKNSLVFSLIFLVIIAFTQFFYTSYYIYGSTKYKKSMSIQSYNPNETNISTIKLFDLPSTSKFDFSNTVIRNRFAFYTKMPSCTFFGVQAILNSLKMPIHKCDSYLNNNGTWLNVVYYSPFHIDTKVSMIFIIVLIITATCIIISLVQIRWSIPFFELQRFAFDIGMRLKATPINPKSNIFVKEIAETFNFMQKRINNVLHYQNKLLAMTCHDIRTPLARIQGRRFKENTKLDQKDQRDIKEINQMLDNLVLFSKENWISGIQFENTNISDFFEECIQEYTEYNKIVRLVNLMQEDLEINLKKPAFKRAINNIINNGLKYGKKVIITIKEYLPDKNKKNLQDKYKLKITISDDGIGIPESEIKNVFTPFYSGSSKKKGNGLGLSITREIIDAHNGKVILYNGKLGGLTVEILI